MARASDGDPVKILAIAVANMKRLFRDRLGLFFVFVLPIVLIVVLGAAFGGGVTPKLGMVGGGGPLAQELRSELDDARDIEVANYGDRASLLDAVEHGVAEGGLLLPADYDERLRSGDDVEVSFLARPGSFLAFSLRTAVDEAIDEQAQWCAPLALQPRRSEEPSRTISTKRSLWG